MHFTIFLCIFVFITTIMFADGIQTEKSELNTNISDFTNFTKLSISVQFPDKKVHGTAAELHTLEFGHPENVLNHRCKKPCCKNHK
jgi:hypothetical protein